MAVEFTHSVVVNGITIDTTVDFKGSDEIFRFPDLFKMDKLHRVSFWRIFVINDSYYRQSGITGGATKNYAPVVCESKNVGRSNQTTAQNQALFEAYSDWKHKLKQLYTEKTAGQVENNIIGDRLRPMLAEKFTDRKKYIKYPCAVSRKLDGVRCMIYSKNNETHIISRLGTVYKNLNGLRREATSIFQDHNIVLDGELYSHDIPFNVISGACREKNGVSEHDEKIEFHIFDVYTPDSLDMPYTNRVELLKDIEKCGISGHPFLRLHFVYYDTVKNEEEIKSKHTQYVAEGYEGLMIRNLGSVYRLGRRTNDLLKYKEFSDEEFKVSDVIEGVGSEKGAAIFVCQTKTGETFSCRPRGSIEKRQLQYQNRSKYIGQLLTVRYQPTLKEEVLPRFPVGIKFADKKVKEDLYAVEIRDYE